MSACEWNPQRNEPAQDGDQWHASAKWCVGAKGVWHLCDHCVTLPQFKRFRVRTPIPFVFVSQTLEPK